MFPQLVGLPLGASGCRSPSARRDLSAHISPGHTRLSIPSRLPAFFKGPSS